MGSQAPNIKARDSSNQTRKKKKNWEENEKFKGHLKKTSKGLGNHLEKISEAMYGSPKIKTLKIFLKEAKTRVGNEIFN